MTAPGAPPGGGMPGPGLDGPVSAAWNALAGVYDPELYLDVVSLEMTLTTQGCPVSESLPEEATAAVQQAAGDSVAVGVRVVWDPPWSLAMMDDTAAAALGFRIRRP